MEGKEALMMGNEACAEGAIAAGVRFFAGYPITPASEIAEILSVRLPQVGGCFIQMEDELGSITAATGASIGGMKALTASSGPGLSLKQEGIGCAAIMEVPLVVINVQRGGPGIGNIQPSQGDVMQARWGSHGGAQLIALAPSSVKECFDLTVQAVNLAERFRVPVLLLSDASVGHMREKIFIPPSVETVERKRPSVAPESFETYDAEDPDGVPPMAEIGTKYDSHYTSFMHHRSGLPAWTDLEVTDALVRRLANKILHHRDEIILLEGHQLEDAKIVVVAYGSTARPAKAAVNMAREKGIPAGLLKLMTLWPFARDEIQRLSGRARAILVPEMNLGQMAGEVERAAGGRCRVVGLNRVDGGLITPEQIFARLGEVF
ncbi:MAG: 2-oxoglutarate ferredoxin oxidoreductase subunit alpha [Deltaproteobacteria bacterium SM23_61]|nr:MAG: 2-oxoglutarate ferredoxin oxidoreductase subunit alpha [Deltaproteobacteria bacterium SM23_61]